MFRAEIGATVTLNYEIKGKEYTTDFTLCGFWETDSLSNIGRIIVSKAFIDNHADLLTYTYPVDNDYSGVVTAYIMFRSGGSVEEKLQQLLMETAIPVIHLEDSPQTKTILLPCQPSLSKQPSERKFRIVYCRNCGNTRDYGNRLFDYLQYFSNLCYSRYSVLRAAKNIGNYKAADQKDY